MYTKTCFMNRSEEKKYRRKEAMIMIERTLRTMRKREQKKHKTVIKKNIRWT